MPRRPPLESTRPHHPPQRKARRHSLIDSICRYRLHRRRRRRSSSAREKEGKSNTFVGVCPLALQIRCRRAMYLPVSSGSHSNGSEANHPLAHTGKRMMSIATATAACAIDDGLTTTKFRSRTIIPHRRLDCLTSSRLISSGISRATSSNPGDLPSSLLLVVAPLCSVGDTCMELRTRRAGGAGGGGCEALL